MVGLFAPIGMLRYKRTRRLRHFEEMFPEALDLLSRAIESDASFERQSAGHVETGKPGVTDPAIAGGVPESARVA